MMSVDDITTLLQEEGATCVLQYGSSLNHPEEANDIDLFALYEGGARPHFEVGTYDVIRLSMDEFEYYRRMLNPVYCTEPCLTGEVVAGDRTVIDDTISEIQEQSPPQRAINHNVNRSMKAFDDCVEALQDGAAEYTSQRLPFVTSYWLYATWYLEGHSPADIDTVRDAAENVDILDGIFQLAAESQNQEQIDSESVADAVRRWQAFVLRSGFEF